MARRRGLTDEDRELWSRVARSAVPMHPQGKPAPAPDRKPAPKQAPRAVFDPPADFGIGQTSALPGPRLAMLATPAERLAQAPLRMDHKTHKRMRKGKLIPQARLDLHGMTLAVAQPVLIRFILSSQSQGMRLVLVITGKGSRGDPGPLPTRPGALRHQVPHWLHMPPLAPLVQQVTAAHYRHGGEGAYYVYLRK